MTSSERSILVVTCFGHFMSHFNMLMFPPLVLPLARQMGLELGSTLELGFWMYLLFGVTALPWGLASDRIGAKPMMMLFFLGAGICAAGAAYYIDQPAAFSLCLAGVGLFSGIYHPAGLGLIARGMERISIGMAYNGIAGNLGLAFAPLLAGLLNWLSGPATGFWALAIFNLAGLALMAVIPLNEPAAPVSQAAAQSEKSLRPFLFLLVPMLMGGLAYRGMSVTLPAYLELKTPGLLAALASIWPGDLSGNLLATFITSLIFLIACAAQYLGGRIGERFDPRWGYLTFHAISLPAVLTMAFVSDLALAVAALVHVFFLLGMQPMENTLVAWLSPPGFKHTAFGSKFTLTFGIGALSVKLAGMVEKAWGLEAVYLGLALVSALLIAGICMVIRETSLHSERFRAAPSAAS